MILVVLGGGGFAAYQLGYLDALFANDSHAATQRPPTRNAEAAEARAADAAPPRARAAPHCGRQRPPVLHARARARRRRASSALAAAALARTGESEAVVPLIAALPKETSNTARLDIYYALARGADRRGTDGLVASLQSSSRDDKLDAARRLAMLGDKRATLPLEPFLDVPQQRLGAAESLAYLADARAIQTLEAIRGDAHASAADKAQAAIALGIAGKPDVAPRPARVTRRRALQRVRARRRSRSCTMRPPSPCSDPPARRSGASRRRRARAAPARAQLDARTLLPPLVARAKAATAPSRCKRPKPCWFSPVPPAWSEHE